MNLICKACFRRWYSAAATAYVNQSCKAPGCNGRLTLLPPSRETVEDEEREGAPDSGEPLVFENLVVSRPSLLFPSTRRLSSSTSQ